MITELNVAVARGLIDDSLSVLETCGPFFGDRSKTLSTVFRRAFGGRSPL
jgi:hypothetical protein